MIKLKPFDSSPRTGLVAIFLALVAVAGIILKLDDFRAFLMPSGTALTWRVVGSLCLACSIVIFLIMNALWKKDNAELEDMKKQVEDIKNRLSDSERKRRTDVITGIPNASSFSDDVNQFFALRQTVRQAQVVLIDIVGFKKVNLNYGYLKGDALLRLIAQHVQSLMRRSEGIYKHPEVEDSPRTMLRQIYRRYPGGDEFAFLIEGDQHEALGFVVNRLHPAFLSLSKQAGDILKAPFDLSFRCAIAPFIPNDTAEDLLGRVGECYSIAAQSKAPFAIAWVQEELEPLEPKPGVVESEEEKKKREDQSRWYTKARQLFEVMNLDRPSVPPKSM